MLGSLMVTQRRQKGASAGTTRSTWRAKTRASPGRRQNSSPNHHGWREVVQRDDGLEATGRCTGRGSRRSVRGPSCRRRRASARAWPIPPRDGRHCTRWQRRGRAPPPAGARSRRPARSLGPPDVLPAAPVVVRPAVAVEATLDLVARGRHADRCSPPRGDWRSPAGVWRRWERSGHVVQLAKAYLSCGWTERAQPRQGGRDDVDLVPRLARRRTHLRFGGVASRLQRRRLHVARGHDHLGHLAPARRRSARRRRGRRRSSRNSPSNSPATVCSERQTAGRSATGASRDKAWSTACSASSTATHMRRRTGKPCPGSAARAWPWWRSARGRPRRVQGWGPAAGGDMPPHQAPVPADVAPATKKATTRADPATRTGDRAGIRGTWAAKVTGSMLRGRIGKKRR